MYLMLRPGHSDVKTVGDLLVCAREQEAASLSTIAERIAAMRDSGAPADAYLRGIENGSRVGGRDLIADWLTALGWTVRSDDEGELVVVPADGDQIRILFGVRAQKEELLLLWNEIRNDELSGGEIVLPAVPGRTSAMLEALLELSADDGDDPRTYLWLTDSRRRVRSILETGRQHTDDGGTSPTVPLSTVLREARNAWAHGLDHDPQRRVIVGTVEDLERAKKTPAWNLAYPAESTVVAYEVPDLSGLDRGLLNFLIAEVPVAGAIPNDLARIPAIEDPHVATGGTESAPDLPEPLPKKPALQDLRTAISQLAGINRGDDPNRESPATPADDRAPWPRYRELPQRPDESPSTDPRACIGALREDQLREAADFMFSRLDAKDRDHAVALIQWMASRNE
jgi:hypothetical protein